MPWVGLLLLFIPMKYNVIKNINVMWAQVNFLLAIDRMGGNLPGTTLCERIETSLLIGFIKQPATDYSI